MYKNLIIYLSIFSLITITGCKKPKLIMRLVNEGNDGYDAWNMRLYNDSSYSMDTGPFSSDKGNYSLHSDTIYFDGAKSGIGKRMIMLKDTSMGYEVADYYSNANTIRKTERMRVLIDNIFFKR